MPRTGRWKGGIAPETHHLVLSFGAPTPASGAGAGRFRSLRALCGGHYPDHQILARRNRPKVEMPDRTTTMDADPGRSTRSPRGDGPRPSGQLPPQFPGELGGAEGLVTGDQAVDRV